MWLKVMEKMEVSLSLLLPSVWQGHCECNFKLYTCCSMCSPPIMEEVPPPLVCPTYSTCAWHCTWVALLHLTLTVIITETQHFSLHELIELIQIDWDIQEENTVIYKNVFKSEALFPQSANITLLYSTSRATAWRPYGIIQYDCQAVATKEKKNLSPHTQRKQHLSTVGSHQVKHLFISCCVTHWVHPQFKPINSFNWLSPFPRDCTFFALYAAPIVQLTPRCRSPTGWESWLEMVREERKTCHRHVFLVKAAKNHILTSNHRFALWTDSLCGLN